MPEYGFWDYTAPGAGGMEHYQRDDHLQLLDDMAQAGMNSLVMVVKWMTTGYRSGLPWLDQDRTNPSVALDNELIRFAIDEAHNRGIKVWLGAVVTEHVASVYGESPHRKFTIFVDGGPREVHTFDLDMPDVAERSVAIFEELAGQFPRADGMLVELEFGDTFRAHRVEPYNRWAGDNGKASGGYAGCPDFRQYATFRRCEVLNAIKRALQAKGFSGDLGTICEVLAGPYSVEQVVDLQEFARQAPDFAVVTYSYNRWDRRLAEGDFLMVQPKEHGLRTYYRFHAYLTSIRNRLVLCMIL